MQIQISRYNKDTNKHTRTHTHTCIYVLLSMSMRTKNLEIKCLQTILLKTIFALKIFLSYLYI